MDLNAKRNKRKQPKTKQPIKDSSVEETNQETLTHAITFQCNTLLYTTLQNMVRSAHTASDFTYTSVADVIRAALQAYQDGMKLTELEEGGSKKQTSLRLNSSLYKFYKSLPNQLRTKILERAIRTFIKK